MKTKQVTGQEALDILNNRGELYCQDYIYFKSVGSIYYKKKDGSLLMKSVLIDDEIKRIVWEAEENQPEYNLTIQQVMKQENTGKYFQDEWNDTITKLMTDDEGDLELVIIKCEKYNDREYLLIEDFYTLETLLNINFKEVQFKC